MLTSLQNPLIKQLRKLHLAKERSATGLFLVEGTHPVESAHRYGWVLEVVCATEHWCESNPDLAARLEAATAQFMLVSPTILAAVADTVNPGGIAAAVKHQERAWSWAGSPSLLVLGETLQDPGNVGTMVRTCAAFEADGLVLSDDSVDPEHPKVLRASAGLWFAKPPLRSGDLRSIALDLQSRGVRVYAADPRAERTLWQADLRAPTAFVLGSEGQGLSEPMRAAVPERLRIPMSPGVESLNVAVSCALLLFEVARQRQ